MYTFWWWPIRLSKYWFEPKSKDCTDQVVNRVLKSERSQVQEIPLNLFLSALVMRVTIPNLWDSGSVFASNVCLIDLNEMCLSSFRNTLKNAPNEPTCSRCNIIFLSWWGTLWLLLSIPLFLMHFFLLLISIYVFLSSA